MAKRKRDLSISPSEMPNRAIQNGLEVAIVDYPSGTRLTQIHSSKTTITVSPRPYRYVVFAHAGQRFGIEVTTTDEFDWCDTNALEVTIAFDLGSEVNQKTVYLLQPEHQNSASALQNDNALILMQEKGSSFTCCIHQIFVPAENEYKGRVIPNEFHFSSVSEDDAILVAFPKARKPLSKIVSEHQGKIRVEIQATKLDPSSGRLTGLQDVLSGKIRARKQSIIDAGISLEVRLAPAAATSIVEYDGAFRSSTSTHSSARTKYTTDFLYRDINSIVEIVRPTYRSELGLCDARSKFATEYVDDLGQSMLTSESSRPSVCTTSSPFHDSISTHSLSDSTIVVQSGESLSKSPVSLMTVSKTSDAGSAARPKKFQTYMYPSTDHSPDTTSAIHGRRGSSQSTTSPEKISQASDTRSILSSRNPQSDEPTHQTLDTPDNEDRLHAAFAKYCEGRAKWRRAANHKRRGLMGKAATIESSTTETLNRRNRLQQDLETCNKTLEDLREQSIKLQTERQNLDKCEADKEQQVEQVIEGLLNLTGQ